uniref:Uncharacterized protein n=1 Tax=Geladintestivirus 5 TaxID=3233137 RepID=A0AAU8MG58_9CAUD
MKNTINRMLIFIQCFFYGGARIKLTTPVEEIISCYFK